MCTDSRNTYKGTGFVFSDLIDPAVFVDGNDFLREPAGRHTALGPGSAKRVGRWKAPVIPKIASKASGISVIRETHPSDYITMGRVTRIAHTTERQERLDAPTVNNL